MASIAYVQPTVGAYGERTTSMLVLRSGRACGLRGAAVVIAMLAATNREPMEYSQKEERFIGGTELWCSI